MSLVNQKVGSYRLVRKLSANQDYKVYQAVHIRSSEERIIRLAKLEGRLNKKESRTRLKQYVESIRAINSPHVIPILKYDIAKIKGKKYFYVITPCTKDENALQEMEKLLNVHVEETCIESEKGLESTLHVLERRLAIAEEEKAQLQRKLLELEQEKERIMRELQEQREEERRRLVIAEEEKERIMRDLREQKESDAKLLAEAILATTGARGADAAPIAPSGGVISRWTTRWFWALGALLLLALLLAGTIFLFAGLFFFGKPVWAFGSSSAKVTITQAAYELTDSYIFTGVTHSISQTKTQSITVPATNLVLIPGKSATGTLTLHNTQHPCNAAVIPTGAIFTDSHGISVATDHVAILGASCTATVPAHAVKRGPTGDIGAHDMKQTYHTTIMVDNPAAFVGGQYDQSYTTVQQSDIDHGASSLAVRLRQETLNSLSMHLLTNEQFVSSPLCKSRVTSDHRINDAATNLNVTVTETCTAEVFNTQEIISRSEQMLNERAQALFGPNYALTGDTKAEITHVATDVKQGTLITVVASGLWTYQFSSARADQLARLITGKDKQDAQSILSDQKGVQSASINISNNDNTMPYNASSINIAYVTTLVPIEEG
jgi:hypothetical protein